jgi:hypothetical protein
MQCVVKIPALNTLYYLEEIPPPDEDLVIEEGAWVDVSRDGEDSNGTDREPEWTLGLSGSDPSHYKLFEYPDQVEAAGFEPTGMRYGGFYLLPHWERLMSILPSLKAFEAMEDNDPPGAMDEAMRYIRGGR